MPRIRRTSKRRLPKWEPDAMTDDELTQVRFFRNIVDDVGAVLFTASPGQQIEATRELDRRGLLPRRPDPRPVLSGEPSDRESARQAEVAYRAENTRLRDATGRQ